MPRCISTSTRLANCFASVLRLKDLVRWRPAGSRHRACQPLCHRRIDAIADLTTPLERAGQARSDLPRRNPVVLDLILVDQRPGLDVLWFVDRSL